MSQTIRLTAAELRAAVPALSSLDDHDLDQLLAKGEVRSYADGELIFAEGNPARALYFLMKGAVAIHKGGAGTPRLDLATLEQGSIFGEVALLAGTPRTASAAAKGPVTALRVIGDSMQSDYREGKRYALTILIAVSRLLAERLETMNRRLVEAVATSKKGEGLEKFRRKMFQDWTV